MDKFIIMAAKYSPCGSWRLIIVMRDSLPVSFNFGSNNTMFSTNSFNKQSPFSDKNFPKVKTFYKRNYHVVKWEKQIQNPNSSISRMLERSHNKSNAILAIWPFFDCSVFYYRVLRLPSPFTALCSKSNF